MSIKVDSLADEIIKTLIDYTEKASAANKAGVDKTAEEAMQIVADKAPKGRSKRSYSRKRKKVKRRPGKYQKAIQIAVAFEDRDNKREYVCVKPNEHALAHLLENGHAMRQGGRGAIAHPHFVYGEKYIAENLEKNIIKELNSIDVT